MEEQLIDGRTFFGQPINDLTLKRKDSIVRIFFVTSVYFGPKLGFLVQKPLQFEIAITYYRVP